MRWGGWWPSFVSYVPHGLDILCDERAATKRLFPVPISQCCVPYLVHAAEPIFDRCGRVFVIVLISLVWARAHALKTKKHSNRAKRRRDAKGKRAVLLSVLSEPAPQSRIIGNREVFCNVLQLQIRWRDGEVVGLQLLFKAIACRRVFPGPVHRRPALHPLVNGLRGGAAASQSASVNDCSGRGGHAALLLQSRVPVGTLAHLSHVRRLNLLLAGPCWGVAQV